MGEKIYKKVSFEFRVKEWRGDGWGKWKKEGWIEVSIKRWNGKGNYSIGPYTATMTARPTMQSWTQLCIPACCTKPLQQIITKYTRFVSVAQWANTLSEPQYLLGLAGWRPAFKSRSGREFSVGWTNGRYDMRLISRTGTEGPPVSSLNCDRCRLWSYDHTVGYKCAYYYYY